MNFFMTTALHIASDTYTTNHLINTTAYVINFYMAFILFQVKSTKVKFAAVTISAGTKVTIAIIAAFSVVAAVTITATSVVAACIFLNGLNV